MSRRHRGGAPKPENSIWGAYIPEITKGHPEMPVRGYIADGRFGKEFRQTGENKKSGRDANLRNWLTDKSYDNLIQKMRETADQAIKSLRNDIYKLEKFIQDN